jgi:hypothetical protein
VHNSRPRLIQRLIPDTARERLDVEVVGPRENESTAFFVDALAMLILQEIHLVDKAEDVRRGAEFFEGFDNGVIGVEVLFDFAGLDVEDVDQDCDVGEDGFALRGKVGFREGGLSTVASELVYM